jgi:UPF0755 protein
MPKKSTLRPKRFIKVFLFLFLIIAIGLWYFLLGKNTGDMHKGNFLYIPTGSNYEQVLELLKTNGFIENKTSFDWLAKRADYHNRVKAGKYKIEPGMSNLTIIRILRSGKQTPVKLTINKIRTKQEFISKISAQLEVNTDSMKQLLSNNEYLSKFQLDSNTSLAAIMPDTYDFWWNTKAEKVFEKIAANYKNFWNANRLESAKKLELSPTQVITLASIVEEETNDITEKDLIASVYLNRLRKGMKLQADPTAKYAFGDFTIKRITSTQTQIPSPYNTYYVMGLPPGPICTPSKSSIDAVLKGTATSYLYFCAKADFSGSHSFANDYASHMINAKKFQEAMNLRNIR